MAPANSQAKVCSPMAVSAPASHWYYEDATGTQQGPFPASQLRQWYEAGYLPSATKCAGSFYGEVPVDSAFEPIDTLWTDPAANAFVGPVVHSSITAAEATKDQELDDQNQRDDHELHDEENEAAENSFVITNTNDDGVEFERNETSEEQLARLLEDGPPGDEPLRLAALDFMEAKKAYWQAKEANATQEALSGKIATLQKEQKFFLAVLKFRTKFAALNKASEFRYVGKQDRSYYFEFRQAAGEPASKLTVTEAREWFNYEFLSTALKFDGWMPLEDAFSHFKAHLNGDELEYTVFKDNGIGIRVPQRWVYYFFDRDFISKSLSRDNMDKKVLIPVGAAARSGSVSRTSLCRETAAVVSFPRDVRNPSKAPDGTGSWLGMNSQEFGLPNIKYRQGLNNYCAFYGLASALDYVGYVNQAAEIAKAAAKATAVSVKSDKMMECARKCRGLFSDLAVVRMVITDKCSPFTFHPDFFYNIQIADGHGYRRHCITVHKNLIFDSNQEKAMHLTKEGLDLCCSKLNPDESFARVARGYCLYPRGPR